eukprot:symbB.v1.2.035138.t1/scaffold4669.1/size36720/2
MVLLPQVEQVYAALMVDIEQEGDHIVITETTVALESSRGRLLGDSSVYIADIPWLCLSRCKKFTGKPPAGPWIQMPRSFSSAYSRFCHSSRTGLDQGRFGRGNCLRVLNCRGTGKNMEKVPNTPVGAVEADEVDRKVADPDMKYAQLALELEAQVSEGQNPLQKMLMLQLKQTSDLVKALLLKAQSDPQRSAGRLRQCQRRIKQRSSGVEGYAARELFLRQIEKEKNVVEHARRNARVELGVAESREEPALMRQYLEQRIPVGDYKIMAQIGFLAAWSWEQATEEGADAGLLCPAPVLCRAKLPGQ